MHIIHAFSRVFHAGGPIKIIFHRNKKSQFFLSAFHTTQQSPSKNFKSQVKMEQPILVYISRHYPLFKCRRSLYFLLVPFKQIFYHTHVQVLLYLNRTVGEIENKEQMDRKKIYSSSCSVFNINSFFTRITLFILSNIPRFIHSSPSCASNCTWQK